MFDLEVEYLPAERIVKLTTHGVLNGAANKQLVAAGLAAGEEHGTARFLVDHRDVRLVMDILELYELPRVNESLGVKRHFQVALVFSPNPDSDQLFQFYENRTHNTGFLQRIFTDEHAARSWLARD